MAFFTFVTWLFRGVFKYYHKMDNIVIVFIIQLIDLFIGPSSMSCISTESVTFMFWLIENIVYSRWWVHDFQKDHLNHCKDYVHLTTISNILQRTNISSRHNEEHDISLIHTYTLISRDIHSFNTKSFVTHTPFIHQLPYSLLYSLIYPPLSHTSSITHVAFHSLIYTTYIDTLIPQFIPFIHKDHILYWYII